MFRHWFPDSMETILIVLAIFAGFMWLVPLPTIGVLYLLGFI